jgi:tetratricopeptide (TPR) repeat protein
MGRKRKRTQNFAKPKQATNRSAPSHTIQLVVSPEQLIKNGDIPKAIDALRTQLINEPTDEWKRLLGDCYFQIGNYKEAANAWLTLDAPTGIDFANVGAAWLNENEWEYAKSALQRSLDLEEQAYPLYLQALAIKGDRKEYELRGEDYASITGLLQKAQALPDCPADAFLLLDDLLNHHNRTGDRTALLKEATQLYPEHTELCLRYARHLAYETNDYIEALIVTEPLLLRTPPSQRALDCAVWSAYKLGFFEDALSYANQLRSSSFLPHGPTVDQVKGDIYLAWGKTDEALACYERETQRDDFEAAFLGFFRIAKVWLVRNEHEKALGAALEGTALWLDYPNEMGGGRVLTYCSVSIGEANDHTNASLHVSGEMVKEVCEAFLAPEQEISVQGKGMLAYLLYKIYEETEPYDEHETISKMDDLLPIVEQGSFHPHMGEHLAGYYANKKDMPRAIQMHLDYCLWKRSALEHYHLKPPANEEDQRFFDLEWKFYDHTAEFSCDQEVLGSLSEVERERCHTIAWEALQAHLTETDVVTTIFVPFFHSFWSDLLTAGDMHRAVVETTKLLVQAATDDDTLWWLLAYHLHELEQLDEAERAYRRYLELAPNSASALHNLSLIIEEKGALQEALALSQKAAALSPDDELIVKNSHRLTRIDTEHQQAQQKQEGATLWSRLTDSQKWLLCLMKLYPSAHWSALLPRVKQDEHQLRQLQEDWEWLLAQGICVQSDDENPVRAVPPLEPYIHEECFQYWLAAEIARVQVRKKKDLWLPAAAELGDEQLADLSASQRGLMQQAFMRQIAQVSLSGLEQVYLHFYRRLWKGLLIKWEMYSDLADSCEVFLTQLPSVMTRHEMWECAYYAGKLSDSVYQTRAEKWYKAYLELGEDHATYHNLSGIYLQRKEYQAALQMIEQALHLEPEYAKSLEQKARIEKAIRQEEERRQQQELERQRQQQIREQQLKSVESTIIAHLGDVDYYKLKILRTLKAHSYFTSKKAFAREVRMEDGPLAGHWKKLVAWGMIIEDGRQSTVHPLVATYLEQGWPVEYGSFTNVIAVPNYETPTAPSNGTSSASKKRSISAITRRDIFDKLCTLKIEGRLDLIEFLELTWPSLDSMPSPNSSASLKSDIRLMIDSPDWEYKFLFYDWLQLGSCDDDLFTAFLASCLHPLVRPDKKEVAELLSFFNEALHPDGYIFKLVSLESGRPIYRAYTFGTNDVDYIVPRAIEIIEQLARNFHLVVRKLSQRHDNRPPLEIRDEYDVQDLFYALLTPFFEDIRPEEVAPSHAGGHGRIDFLIKTEQIVIEIKKTRPSLKVKELRDQLIIDKEIYRTHPHCRTFIAFIYDPDGYIDNAVGFERDLSNTPGDIRVKVIVAPR